MAGRGILGNEIHRALQLALGLLLEAAAAWHNGLMHQHRAPHKDDPLYSTSHFVALALFALVALVCLALVVIYGRCSWWALIAAAIGLPTIIVVTIGGPLSEPAIRPLTQFILDVVVPPTCVGTASCHFRKRARRNAALAPSA
jgi:hypothetical protein